MSILRLPAFKTEHSPTSLNNASSPKGNGLSSPETPPVSTERRSLAYLVSVTVISTCQVVLSSSPALKMEASKFSSWLRSHPRLSTSQSQVLFPQATMINCDLRHSNASSCPWAYPVECLVVAPPTPSSIPQESPVAAPFGCPLTSPGLSFVFVGTYLGIIWSSDPGDHDSASGIHHNCQRKLDDLHDRHQLGVVHHQRHRMHHERRWLDTGNYGDADSRGLGKDQFKVEEASPIGCSSSRPHAQIFPYLR